MGTKRNLGLRVLCLNNCIPRKAPKGPRNASDNKLDSGTLIPPLIAHNLSRPKKTREIRFTIMRIIRGTWSNLITYPQTQLQHSCIL
jgi:hypothetical protein